MGAAISSAHAGSAAPSSSGGGLLTLCHCSSVGSLSQETVLHKLLQRESFPRGAALHTLPQRGSLPTGCSPSGTGCSSVGPPRGHKPCQQTCSGVGSSLHSSAGPGRSLLQRGLPTGSQLPSSIHLLRRGVLHGLQGNLCSSTCSTSSLPPSLTLVSARLSLSHILTPLSPGAKLCYAGLFSFLNLLSQRRYHHR